MIVLPIRIKLSIVLILTALLSAGLIAHVHWLNGPEYWKWPWRHVPAARWYPPMLLAAAPLLLVASFARLRNIFALPLLMISMLGLQIAAAAMPESPPGLRRLIYTIESPSNTSYFADADRSMDIPIAQLLHDYPRLMPQFQMHSQEKPPGPILFFRAILAMFGPSDRTALIAALTIAALATLAIPATYLLISVLTKQPGAALFGAMFIALSPGLVLHLPQMDQLYPIFTAALIIAWHRALSQNSSLWRALWFITSSFWAHFSQD